MRYNGALFFNLSGCSWQKESGVKFLSLFFVFLLSLNSLPSFSAPVPQVIQKPADEPGDRAIRIKAHNGGEYCYALAFVDGEGYVYLDNCSSQRVPFARYDVFQRIAWKIKDIWLCMTAPSSVTAIGGGATADWDYIKLRPCVINDANQRWVVKDNAFYTADEKFRVKDYKWYTYISKNAKDYYDHTLMMPTMDKWVKTIAMPGNMSFKTSLGWKYASGPSFFMYYISDNGSKAEVFDLYYNPENGHIARYFPSSGLLSCMAPQQSSSEEWNWVKWLFCNDNISATKDSGYWDISFLVGREGPILDSRGNLLRVTQYGSNWGVPYTAKPDYLRKDTQNSPTSEFVLDYDIERWNRYVAANAEDALPYCPAPGKEQNIPASKQRVKRTLPPDFQLDETWQRRLYATATTTTGARTVAGLCGACFLQAMQMVAELQENFPGPPRQRGYFFDPAPYRDPVRELERRFPFLHRALELANTLYDVSIVPGRSMVETNVMAATAVVQVALPMFSWERSSIAIGRDDILASIRGLLAQPPGTIWLALLGQTTASRRATRHVLPILRSRNGLIIIQTNFLATTGGFADFSRTLAEASHPEVILWQIGSGLPVNNFTTLRLTGPADRPLSVTISQNNCTGEGEGRRGSGGLPRSALVNQCASGRCPL
ncbi:hypothetical protein BAnh1_04170 [Bartonella australis AUST/NH1]|uniref:PF07598 family protein n=1 Tax=Bartonella australis (strain Aust/NH1) TaxID=1094489 RepID=M1NSH6_BARAA|nr:DUF1561 family protein [Bartonella australis]AGF74298.1 hypothetical protein BAnh1_04170 [Bartonella australis AUST/NH1]